MTMVGVTVITAILSSVFCMPFDRHHPFYNSVRSVLASSLAQMRKMLSIQKVNQSPKITQVLKNWDRKWGFHSL